MRNLCNKKGRKLVPDSLKLLGDLHLKYAVNCILGHNCNVMACLSFASKSSDHNIYLCQWLYAQKKLQLNFHPNSARPTSKSWNVHLKVIPEGSMQEYLWVGSKAAHKAIVGKKYFWSEIPRPLSPAICAIFQWLTRRQSCKLQLQYW